jgi:hypothetical protein
MSLKAETGSYCQPEFTAKIDDSFALNVAGFCATQATAVTVKA